MLPISIADMSSAVQRHIMSSLDKQTADNEAITQITARNMACGSIITELFARPPADTMFPQKRRKPGVGSLKPGGKKRKIDVATYKRKVSDKVSELENMESLFIQAPPSNLTANKTEKLTQKCRKERVAIKNRLSAKKSREKKRLKIETLRGEALALQRQIAILQRENLALRVRRPLHASASTPSPSLPVGDALQTKNAPSDPETNSSVAPERRQTQPPCTSSHDGPDPILSMHSNLGGSSQPLSESFPNGPDTVSQMRPCVVHAPPRPRVSASSVVKKYSWMHWGMPWETLGSIFLSLGEISLALIEKQNERSAMAEYEKKEQYLGRVFCHIWMSYSRNQCFLNDTDYDGERIRQEADTIFGRISLKFMIKIAQQTPLH